jgi:hypothetical protein
MLTKHINSKYVIQIFTSFSIGLVSLIALFLLDDPHGFTMNLFLLSLFGGFFNAILNSVLNYLNLTFSKKQNVFLAFNLPLLIWGFFILFTLIRLFESQGSRITDWLMLLWWTESFLYNFFLKKYVLKDTKGLGF